MKEWINAQVTELGAHIGKNRNGEKAGAVNKEQPRSPSDAARISRENAELLREIHLVVFQREPKNKAEFGSLVDSLNQGASLEGIYNGFTHSADYRRLEMANPGASPKALTIFGKELDRLEKELPEPTPFDSSWALPLPLPVQPGLPEADAQAPADIPAEVDFSAAGQTAPEKYSKLFVGASIYTLKRVLGDHALKVLAHHASDRDGYREKAALWYSRWVSQMAAYKMDFGLPQRNQTDEAFHYEWALKAPEDRLRWEVLNRVHRVLNAANR